MVHKSFLITHDTLSHIIALLIAAQMAGFWTVLTVRPNDSATFAGMTVTEAPESGNAVSLNT